MITVEDWLSEFSPYKMATMCKIYLPKIPNSQPHVVRSAGVICSYGKLKESLYKTKG